MSVYVLIVFILGLGLGAFATLVFSAWINTRMARVARGELVGVGDRIQWRDGGTTATILRIDHDHKLGPIYAHIDDEGTDRFLSAPMAWKKIQ